nr:alpha-glucosidase C-terminal domain-containing protein [Planococcus sp. ISL-110]
MDVLVYGEYQLLELGHDAVFAYTREYGDDKVLIVTNLGQHACLCDIDPEDATLLLANYQNIDPAQLLPYEARVYKIPKESFVG